MLARVSEVIAELKTNPPPLPVEEIAEAIQFLEWLIADNFTFLGVRDYALAREAAARAAMPRPGSASCARPTCRCCDAAPSSSRSRRRSSRSSTSRRR